MRILNRTPFQPAPLVGRLSFPGHSLTLIVKGTFDLAPSARATAPEQQLHPTGDETHDDDPEGTGSARYESDFAYFKPRADVLLAGTCHAPEGRPVRRTRATLAVGPVAKSIDVVGDRRWTGLPGFRSPSTPEPFTAMPLRYERSFGGAHFDANPVGVGHRHSDSHGDDVWHLPNLEDPDHPIHSTLTHPAPAGFGPLGRGWGLRQGLIGTYRRAWLKERWPWLPVDFDFGHYNAAPPDQQVEGYLRGDERLCLENLHPEHARYEAELPGVRVRCFVTEASEEGDGEASLREVAMNLDTLWIDMDAEKLVLVWRGWTEIRSDDYAELEHLFVLAEPLDAAPASLEACSELLAATLAEMAAEGAAPEAPPAEEPPPAPPEAEADGPEVDAQGLRAEIDAQVSAILAQAGVSFDDLPPEARAAYDEQQAAMLDDLLGLDPDAARLRELAKLEVQRADAFEKLGLDPANLPPLSARAAQEQVRLFQELGVEDAAAVITSPEVAPMLQALAVVLPKIGIDPEDLGPVIEAAKAEMERLGLTLGEEEEQEEAAPEEPPEPAGPPTRESVERGAAAGESFAGAELAGLDLSGLTLAGLDFSGADLSGASLVGADLRGAILANARLPGADLATARLDGAVLAGADLAGAKLDSASLTATDGTGANLAGASLREAVLTDALLARAQMAEAVLEQASAEGATFLDADLSRARLARAALSKADFSRCVLAGADFSGATLAAASIEAASCSGANFADTDLTELRASQGSDFAGCRFSGARAPESIWEGANLADADFSRAILHGALFAKASLPRADLCAADMRQARFPKADLRGARVRDANLFEGSLEQADLSGADFSGANCYATEFLDAVLEDAIFDGANLRMSKLG